MGNISRLFLLLVVFSVPSNGYKLQPADDVAALTAMDDCGKKEVSEPNQEYERKCPIKLDCPSRSKASCIAQKAAKEAKDASDAQIEAGEAAARQVKQQLADKAHAAAKAAEAALAGKQLIVEQLESEVQEGELVVHEESVLLEATKNTYIAAGESAKQADTQVKNLIQAAKNAQDNVANSEHVASSAQQELTAKQQLVEAAKKRVEMLLKQLDTAKIDFKSTKTAAEKAACAAHEARQRAARERRRADLYYSLWNQRIQNAH